MLALIVWTEKKRKKETRNKETRKSFTTSQFGAGAQYNGTLLLHIVFEGPRMTILYLLLYSTLKLFWYSNLNSPEIIKNNMEEVLC